MTTNCFVCLSKARNKVCTNCECYAHPGCFGEYLKHSTEVETYIFQDHVIVTTPLSAACPLCRGRITTVKPTTRSDTHFARCVTVVNTYKNLLFKLELLDDDEERDNLLSSVFDFLAENRALFKSSVDFSRMVRTKLQQLYYEENWEPANLHHRTLFGVQLTS